jgi:ligand-binding sensor domain-containing protein
MVDSNGWTPVLPDQWVQFLLVDEDVLWIGTADGLYRRDSSGIELIVEEDVHALFREEGALWVGTRSGLLRLAV